MAFQPSAPPLEAYQPLSGYDEITGQGKPSTSSSSHGDIRYQTYSVDSHNVNQGRHVMGPQHPQRQLGLVSGSPVQHHDGRLRYLLPVPASDSSVVFGFPVRVRQVYPRWHTGLCGCCADPGVCLLGCCCPCILFGRIASELDDGATSCVVAALIWYILQQFTAGGCGWIYSFLYRDKLRARYGIPRHPGCDCIIHFCCWPCAFCQEYRELRFRRSSGETSMVRRAIMAAPPRQVMRY